MNRVFGCGPNTSFNLMNNESRYSSALSICEETVEEERRICIVGEAKHNKEVVNILVNHYLLFVIYSDKGIEYCKDPDVTFVIQDFESPDFKYLNSSSKLIIGPAIIRYSFLNRKPLPRLRENRPVYCCSMKGMRFSISGYTVSDTRRAVDLIHFMSGSARKRFSPEDILIAKNVVGDKYRSAVSMSQRVLTLEWIEECWRRRDDISFFATDSEIQQKFQLKCFQCLRIFFVGFSDCPDWEEMLQKTVEFGGIVATKYEESTHAVCAEDLTTHPSFASKYLPNMLEKVKHVTREWFWKSLHMQQCASEELYSACSQLIQQPRPLQSRENLNRKRNAMGDSPSANSTDEILRTNRKNNSKASLDNLENSNNSSALPEHMYSAENLDYGNGTPKKNSRRYQVCMELLETEENYLRVLHLMVNLYKNPLEEMFLKNDELLNKKEISIIFSKIPAIIQVHTNIYNNLCAIVRDWRPDCLIGHIFAHSASEFAKVYPPYINSYDESLRTLEHCEHSRPRFHTFLKMAESKPECQKNSLRDLLIRPVQRIPSVLLLLQELLKRTDRPNKDIDWLNGAIDCMKRVLEKSNESRRQTETFQQFLEVCSEIEDLPPEVINSDRQFIQSIDVLVLEAGGALQNCRSKIIALFLFNDLVVFAKSRHHGVSLNSTMGGASSTMSRLSLFRPRERKPYKLVNMSYFVAFRSIELIRSHGVFVLKLRDHKADELCIFQLTNGTSVELGISFFENLIKRLMRDVVMEELTMEQLRNDRSRPEECEIIRKALGAASELNSQGLVRRPSQLRRAVSNVSLGFGVGLGRWKK